MRFFLSLTIALVAFVLTNWVSSETILLQEQNFQEIVQSTELVLANFYADWCHFSRQLAPIFEETSVAVAKEFAPEQIKLTKVDCESPQGQPLAQRFGVNKYPTLKLFRNGEMVRREYRGSRSADAIKEYLRKEMQDPIEYSSNLMSVLKFEDKNRHIVLLVKSGSENEMTDKVMSNAKKLARSLKDDCKFHAFIGELPQSVVGDDSLKIRFISPVTESFVDFHGNAESFFDLEVWLREKCIPLVREITFENAEEMTEEGVPFLILFHDPSDKEAVKVFTEEVRKQLPDQRGLINPVYADGNKFSHPLSHLGKSSKDLPVLAIDSFKHMYLFPFDVSSQLTKPGLLRQFVLDLHSGKLHREFHQGPDPTEAPQLSYDPVQEQHKLSPQGMTKRAGPWVPDAFPPRKHQQEKVVTSTATPSTSTTTTLPPTTTQEPYKADDKKAEATAEPHVPKSKAGDEDDAIVDYEAQAAQAQPHSRTDPPESMFAKLAPSRLRYSMARDEL